MYRYTRGKRPGLRARYQLQRSWHISKEMWLELQSPLRTTRRDLSWEFRGKMLSRGEKFGMN